MSLKLTPPSDHPRSLALGAPERMCLSTRLQSGNSNVRAGSASKLHSCDSQTDVKVHSVAHAQMAALRGNANQARQCESRLDAMESAAAGSSESTAATLSSFEQTLEAVQSKVAAHIAEHASKRDADARQTRSTLETLLEAQRVADSRVGDLMNRSKKLASSMEHEVARISAAVAATSVAMFGVSEPPRQQRGVAVVTQLEEYAETMRKKCDGAAVDEIRQLSAQVRNCFGSTLVVRAAIDQIRQLTARPRG